MSTEQTGPAKYNILIVDDQPNSVKPLMRLLAHQGYAVQYADSLPSALDQIRKQMADLVLVDVHLGPDSGFDLFRRIRELPHPAAQEVPILFLSGVDEAEARISGLQLGAMDFILKPSTPNEIQVRIELQLRLKEGEKLLKARNQELVKAYDELRAAQKQAIQAEKFASIGRMSAGIAHEMSTPLSFIISNLKMLAKYLHDVRQIVDLCHELSSSCVGAGHPNADLVKAHALQVQGLCERFKAGNILQELDDITKDSIQGSEMIAKIAGDLKEYSRDGQEDREPLDLNDLVAKALTLARNQFGDRIAVECDYLRPLPAVMCSGGRMTQVFLNLLVNSAQAIENRGTIRVSTRVADGHVVVAVADTGCGIKPENMKRIFEPFFTTKSVEKGTGLGLSIAEKIVSSYGGTITAESELGKGTKVTVTLPVTAAAPAPKKAEASGSSAAAAQ